MIFIPGKENIQEKTL